MKAILFFFAFIIVACVSAKAQTGGGIYIKIDGMPANITSGIHAGETKISAMEQEIIVIPPSTGGSTGKAEIHEFIIKKPFSSSTPKLIRNTLGTVHIPFVEIKFYDNAETLVSIIRLEDVSITKMKTLAPECTSCPPSFEEIGMKAGFKIIWTHVASNSVTTVNVSTGSITYTGL